MVRSDHELNVHCVHVGDSAFLRGPFKSVGQLIASKGD